MVLDFAPSNAVMATEQRDGWEGAVPFCSCVKGPEDTYNLQGPAQCTAGLQNRRGLNQRAMMPSGGPQGPASNMAAANSKPDHREQVHAAGCEYSRHRRQRGSRYALHVIVSLSFYTRWHMAASCTRPHRTRTRTLGVGMLCQGVARPRISQPCSLVLQSCGRTSGQRSGQRSGTSGCMGLGL